MVDSTKGIGQVPGVSQSQPAKSVSREKLPEAKRTAPQDEVEISKEALSLQEAEGSARETREALEKDPGLTLGLDPEFDEESA